MWNVSYIAVHHKDSILEVSEHKTIVPSYTIKLLLMLPFEPNNAPIYIEIDIP